MSYIARHIPGLAATLSLSLCIVLTVLGHKSAFDQKIAATSPVYNTQSISHLVLFYHNRPHNPNLIYTLSATLAPDQPIRRLAFIAHLAFAPTDQLIATYLHHTAFGPVLGLKRASIYYFDVHHSKLTAGEILLLCDLAQGADLPINDPIATLKRRDTLLTDLHNQGLMPTAIYRWECNKALSLSADHRPVN